MRKMNSLEKNTIEREIRKVLQYSVSDEYVNCILDNYDPETGKTFIEAVTEDVMETSAWNDRKYYNESDIRYAIGRVCIARMGMDY